MPGAQVPAAVNAARLLRHACVELAVQARVPACPERARTRPPHPRRRSFVRQYYAKLAATGGAEPAAEEARLAALAAMYGPESFFRHAEGTMVRMGGRWRPHAADCGVDGEDADGGPRRRTQGQRGRALLGPVARRAEAETRVPRA